MRMGLMTGATRVIGNRLEDLISYCKEAERRGFDSMWVAHAFGLDAVSGCALAGRETSRIELCTAVTPTWTRHPGALAQQALTAGDACDGRFVLGIGLSHQVMIEGMFGLSFDKPAAHMSEYLQIIAPLLAEQKVDFEGRQLSCRLKLNLPGAAEVPLMVAALGPAMLKLAGTYTSGTITWMTGPKTIENHILPLLSSAAEAAGRPAPRVVCGLPVLLTREADAAREKIGKQLAGYGQLPSYRAMLDREGVAEPAQLALVGDEATLRAGIQRLRDIGVTDFNAAIMPQDEDGLKATLDLLQSEL